ncbi:nitroreductase family protein [Desulforamulus aquiferis]|uniref:Nitroreductase family protein n=1 Tax=Desulforamulus aquiferis TaxID=1397668 RepID=A0AAW7Z8Z6_9FIRM|nr:nitroreductase family protein [Desulforamulus aquiferis]MDO7785911.1 nitroreductase family protein [Desulforamulus aquiferis]
MSQYFDRPIIEVIRDRTSVRTYKSDAIPEEIRQELMEFASTIQGPFQPKVRFQLINDGDIAKNTDGKIGTYGVIKGARSYIAGIVEKGEGDLEQLGYIFEKLILFATALNLGTCWLGGTFTRSGFEKLLKLQDHEMLPAITPVGYKVEKKRILESLMRFTAGSNNRKDWKELFFNEGFDKPIQQSEAGEYITPLEMVRLAPSASNKQPWRIVKMGEQWQFYLCSSKGYAKAMGYNIQRIDIGIAMCHFEMTVKESGRKGHWIIDTGEQKQKRTETMEHIASWVEE